jgi:uncharacterized cysteine cluster protein YcgN (CxxCxxCC family)
MTYMAYMDDVPFWRRKTLDEMTSAEWESLCDGCGRCCLNKLEDIDSGEIIWTDIACKLLDGESCRCRNYKNRRRYVPDCVKLTPESVRTITWLPPTCAYRLVADGRQRGRLHDRRLRGPARRVAGQGAAPENFARRKACGRSQVARSFVAKSLM